MLLADRVEYRPLKVHNQGSMPYCASYAFFTLLAEYIQQKHAIDAEFDFEKLWQYVEDWRRKPLKAVSSNSKKSYGNFGRMESYFRIAQEEGFEDKNGDVWGITTFRRFSPTASLDMYLNVLQQGCMVFVINSYEGHNWEKQPLKEPTGAKKGSHAMIFIGFDYPKGVFLYQNSWGGKQQIKEMPFTMFAKYGVEAFFVPNIKKL